VIEERGQEGGKDFMANWGYWLGSGSCLAKDWSGEMAAGGGYS